ncbi:MAG: plastocyanin/azurin family copper-binding protein [Pseudomonadota bacterium]
MRSSRFRSGHSLLALLAVFALTAGGCSQPAVSPASAPTGDVEGEADTLNAAGGDADAEASSDAAAPAPKEEQEAPLQVAEAPEPAAQAPAASDASGGGTVHTVMAQGVKFEPMFVYIEPGDTVQWTNMAAHNIETLDAMVPEGQEKVLSDMGSEVAVTFDKEGVVVYKCTPHWSTRMGGMVVVGKPDDPAAIVEKYLAAIASDPSALPAKGLLKKLMRDMEARNLL